MRTTAPASGPKFGYDGPMRIAFVPAWFGPEIPGGSEQVCRELATRCAAAGDEIEVLTTCIRDFHANWGKNHHSPGVTRELDLPVRRFAVKWRPPWRVRAFDRVNANLMAGERDLTPRRERTYITGMFRCPGLFEYLARNRDDYDAFFFNPYMFATTCFGVEAVGERAIVLPALHDEAYAYMNIYHDMMRRAGVVVSQTPEETDLIGRIYGPEVLSKVRPIGMGVETDWSGNGGRFRRRHGIDGLVFLYAGRRERQKGVYDLVEAFRSYRAAGGAGTLVLMGSGRMDPAPDRSGGVLDLGFLRDQDKYDALAAADVFCLPSRHESFSISLMEAFLAETPAVVHAECAVTRGHCLRAQAGLYCQDRRELAAAMAWLADHPDRRGAMGRGGRQYVLEHYQWPEVIERFRQAMPRRLQCVANDQEKRS